MLEVLKYNNISISVNMTAVKYMLTYGYMLENVTFCQEIHRLLPGTKLSVTKDTTSYEIVRLVLCQDLVQVKMRFSSS